MSTLLAANSGDVTKASLAMPTMRGCAGFAGAAD
jgi:hypothetical protein